jgi:hypothetical protein
MTTKPQEKLMMIKAEWLPSPALTYDYETVEIAVSTVTHWATQERIRDPRTSGTFLFARTNDGRVFRIIRSHQDKQAKKQLDKIAKLINTTFVSTEFGDETTLTYYRALNRARFTMLLALNWRPVAEINEAL